MTKTEVKQQIKRALKWALNISAPLFSKKSSLTPDEALKRLEQLSPKPNGSVNAQNVLQEPICDLQIIIPAYNAEKYLSACMNSVLSQKTQYSFHVVLVDDGSTDQTPAIADSFSSDNRVTVIHQPNAGHSGARNAGLDVIFGKYIMFVDSDDTLCGGAIEALLNAAYEHDSDLVEGGTFFVFDHGKSVMNQYPCQKQVQNPYDTLHGFPWGKVYKAAIFEKLCFPKGYWYEDSILAFLIFPAVKKPWVIPQMVYNYYINQAGIVKTSQGKPKSIDTYWITEYLLQAYISSGYPLDAAIFRYFLHQVRLNQLRVSALPEDIQESVFILSCSLLEQYFPAEKSVTNYKALHKALKTRDFGAFKVCCRIF